MMCEKCGKFPADSHLKTNINGHVFEQHLCQHCTSSANFGEISFSNMLSSLLESKGGSSQTKCPGCGYSFKDIVDSGFAGCAKCYDIFYRQLLPSIQRIHGGQKHLGRKIKPDKLSRLKDALASAVEREDYETAVKLRDEIKGIQI